MPFPRGTWFWEAVTTGGVVLSRENGARVVGLKGLSLRVFRLRSSSPVAQMSLSRQPGACAVHYGIKLDRNKLDFTEMDSVEDLRFTRRQSGAVGGPITDEEILVRFTWKPTGQVVRVHLRPGQVLVMDESRLPEGIT